MRMQKKGKKYTPPRPYFLRFEPLETRMLPSVNLGLPQRPSTLEGALAGGHNLSWFEPATGGMQQISLSDNAALSVAGSLTLDQTGSLDFHVQLHATEGQNTFYLDALGTSGFNNSAAADYAGGQYVVTGNNWQDSVQITYVFQEWDGSGALIRNESSSASFTWSDASGDPLGGVQAVAFSWYGCTQHLSDLRNFSLGNLNWTDLTVSEHGTATFILHESGTQTLTGSGTRPSDNGQAGWAGSESVYLTEILATFRE
jgi:hypothetical protein